ncbi:MAG: uracil-DNA glycosylase [Rhizobiales bacterium]|nr:uracil-DNA glycosylase [Hyphomicrobiales bacterium]MBI3673217.1 uracil-DNA glycosylase [Hyphomicrobiales bacterium]
MAVETDPARDCPLCPRLVAFRLAHRQAEPSWHNAPVASFGDPRARLLIVGLAPGLRGANRTGRPFTGDHAGELLYGTLLRFGFAKGEFRADPADGLELVGTRVTNAVRCVPPENKPTPTEIRICNRFLVAQFAEPTGLRAVVGLGRIAHDAVLVALGMTRSRFAFAHGAAHDLGRLRLFDSYHCSRYNTNTGVLTPAMFEAVFARVKDFLG